jgi:four helix bundle protein
MERAMTSNDFDRQPQRQTNKSELPAQDSAPKEPQLRDRTKQFALRVIRLVEHLPKRKSADVLGCQLLRSATSVGANYRAACRGRSSAEFRSKMGIVEEEADETAYWIELLMESGIVKPHLLENLHQEATEIVAMTVASIRTSKQRERGRKNRSTKQRKEP